MINSEGYAVSFGSGSNGGDTGRPPSQVYYCGRRMNQCRCGSCDGRCGPTNGCPCNSCKELTLSNLPHISHNVCCPRGHAMGLSGRQTSWGCDGRREPGGCVGTDNESIRSRWRCTQGCDFDYCGACYTKKVPKPKIHSNYVINCEGVMSIPSFDSVHTGAQRHYCGRNVGHSRYANQCRTCNGNCGPSNGCQCRACFIIDNPKFLSPTSTFRPTSPSPSQNEQQPTSNTCELLETSEGEIPLYCYSYSRSGDVYVGQMVDNRRDGFGTYSYCVGGKGTSSPHYIEYKGEWKHNQIIKYLSYENVWWKCTSPPLCNLPTIPISEDDNSITTNFDTNIFKVMEFLIIDRSFCIKYLQKIILCQNFVNNKNQRIVTSSWVKLSISFTLQFSEDFNLIESGQIFHSPSNTVIMTFGKILLRESEIEESATLLSSSQPDNNNNSNGEEDEDNNNNNNNNSGDITLLAEFHPGSINTQLFQTN